MNLRTTFVLFAIVLVGAFPLSAQDIGEGQTQTSSMVKHADIGQLEAIGAENDRIVTARSSDDYRIETVRRTYDTNAETVIRGLEPAIEVSGIPADARGNIVVVTYVAGDERPLATNLYFPGTQEIRESHGTITSVDRDENLVVIESAQDQAIEFNVGVGPGAAIDSNEGLLALSDLRPGQDATVYHAPIEWRESDGGFGRAYLIYRHE